MTQDQMKEAIIQFLPNALCKAIKSYEEYILKMDEEKQVNDTKEFKDHHAACKVAISHIELLIKLSEWVGISENINQEESRIKQLSQMVAEARKHLEKNNQ